MRSSSLALAVSITIGTSDRLRTSSQISSPLTSGSMRSSTIRSGFLLSASARPSRPFAAVNTVNPSFSRYAVTTSRTDSSSSITTMRR